MKSLAELRAIKEKMKDQIALREDAGEIRVVVGMATCGISAGARPVLNTFLEEVAAKGLASKVSVSQTGCAGMCQLEPIVDVFVAGTDKVTYVEMTPDKVKKVVEEHLINGKVVTEYTVAGTKA